MPFRPLWTRQEPNLRRRLHDAHSQNTGTSSMKSAAKILGSIFIALMIIGWLFGGEPTSPYWRIARNLSDENTFRFIIITPGLESEGYAYKDAIDKLCNQQSSPSFCDLSFFSEGDRLPPPNQSKKDFFQKGGFSGYRMLAHYSQNRGTGSAGFTTWECERAGIKDAPLSALCGEGVRENYSAALALGGYISTASSCGWPQTKDEVYFTDYLKKLENSERKNQYKEAFDKMLKGNGPDDRANCTNLRARMEERVKEARQVLGIPQPPPPPSSSIAAPAKSR